MCFVETNPESSVSSDGNYRMDVYPTGGSAGYVVD